MAKVAINGDCPGGLVNLFWNPAYFWRPNGTHCLNLATSNLFFSRDMAICFFKFSKNPFIGFASPSFFGSPGGENSPQKKKPYS
jgi:hypothetical protein